MHRQKKWNNQTYFKSISSLILDKTMIQTTQVLKAPLANQTPKEILPTSKRLPLVRKSDTIGSWLATTLTFQTMKIIDQTSVLFMKIFRTN